MHRIFITILATTSLLAAACEPAVNDGKYVAALKAIRSLDFNHSKVATLTKIAMKEDLDATDQQRLIDTTIEIVDFPHYRTEIMKALLANPKFTPDSREYLLTRMNDIATYESQKLELIQLMTEQDR